MGDFYSFRRVIITLFVHWIWGWHNETWDKRVAQKDQSNCEFFTGWIVLITKMFWFILLLCLSLGSESFQWWKIVTVWTYEGFGKKWAPKYQMLDYLVAILKKDQPLQKINRYSNHLVHTSTVWSNYVYNRPSSVVFKGFRLLIRLLVIESFNWIQKYVLCLGP